MKEILDNNVLNNKILKDRGYSWQDSEITSITKFKRNWCIGDYILWSTPFSSKNFYGRVISHSDVIAGGGIDTELINEFIENEKETELYDKYLFVELIDPVNPDFPISKYQHLYRECDFKGTKNAKLITDFDITGIEKKIEEYERKKDFLSGKI